jgi:phage-related protein (TIGR01555 family)
MARQKTSKGPIVSPEIKGDGWVNPYTGFGTSRDRSTAGYYARDGQLYSQELKSLYYGDDICATIVDAPVEESFRNGYCLTAKDKQLAEEFDKWTESELHLSEKLEEAETYARIYGGSLIVLGLDDGQTLDKPLNPNAVKSIDWMLTLDRRYAQPMSYYSDLGPKLGMPASYNISYYAGRSTKSFLVHESRCVRFRGVKVDFQRQAELAGWDQSVLQRPYDVLRKFAAGWDNAAAMLGDASQGIFKMQGLTELLSTKNESTKLADRMRAVDMTRSVTRSMVVDKEREDFTRVTQSFSGVPEMLDRFMQRLSAACKIPVSILMGRSAAGMNATGDLDVKSWEKQVAAYQKRSLTPRIREVLSLLQLAKDSPSKGKAIEKLETKWHPLSQPSTKEEADTRLAVANADAVYLDRDVYKPEQIAIARSGRGEWSMDAPEVDVEALEAAMQRAETFEDTPTPNTPQGPNALPQAQQSPNPPSYDNQSQPGAKD